MASIIIIDPSISNGTCWSGPNQPASSIFIPCGNDAFGPQVCCQARDICLSNNACYNGKWGVTYLAGCTDQTYSDSDVCPNKGEYGAQFLVGLVRCFVSNNTQRNQEEWTGCENDIETAVASPSPCTCDPATDTILFTAGPVLTNVASLPVSVSNAIAWYDGFTPSITITITTSTSNSSIHSTTTTRSSSSSPTVQATSQPTFTSSQDPPIDRSLSTEAKVGIGIGVGLGTIILCIFLSRCIWRRRKKSKAEVPPVMDQIRPRSQIDPTFHNQSYLDVRGSTASGQKSELAANEIVPMTPPGTSHAQSVLGISRYQPYRPDRFEAEGSPTGAKTRPEGSIVHELPG